MAFPIFDACVCVPSEPEDPGNYYNYFLVCTMIKLRLDANSLYIELNIFQESCFSYLLDIKKQKITLLKVILERNDFVELI